MYDEITVDNSNGAKTVYKDDCFNLPFCEMPNETSPFLSCLKGANVGNRCSRGEKMILYKLSQLEKRIKHLEKIAKNQDEH